MIVEYWDYITRDDLHKNPEKIFLFGDNLDRRGYGGQAGEMRGETNALGIPTLKGDPSKWGSDGYFSDDEFEENKRRIRQAFDLIPKGRVVVVPSMGLGTGAAQLETRAPRTYAYLLKCIEDLENDEDFE